MSVTKTINMNEVLVSKLSVTEIQRNFLKITYSIKLRNFFDNLLTSKRIRCHLKSGKHFLVSWGSGHRLYIHRKDFRLKPSTIYRIKFLSDSSIEISDEN